MRKFHGDDAVRLQKKLHAANKVINVRYLSKDVIAQQEIRLFSGIGEFAGSFPSKKFYEGRHTSLNCHGRDVRSWLDSKNRHFLLHEVLQKVAVIAR